MGEEQGHHLEHADRGVVDALLRVLVEVPVQIFRRELSGKAHILGLGDPEGIHLGCHYFQNKLRHRAVLHCAAHPLKHLPRLFLAKPVVVANNESPHTEFRQTVPPELDGLFLLIKLHLLSIFFDLAVEEVGLHQLKEVLLHVGLLKEDDRAELVHHFQQDVLHDCLDLVVVVGDALVLDCDVGEVQQLADQLEGEGFLLLLLADPVQPVEHLDDVECRLVGLCEVVLIHLIEGECQLLGDVVEGFRVDDVVGVLVAKELAVDLVDPEDHHEGVVLGHQEYHHEAETLQEDLGEAELVLLADEHAVEGLGDQLLLIVEDDRVLEEEGDDALLAEVFGGGAEGALEVFLLASVLQLPIQSREEDAADCELQRQFVVAELPYERAHNQDDVLDLLPALT